MQHFCLCLSVLPYELLVAQSSMGPETSLQCSHKSLPLELILEASLQCSYKSLPLELILEASLQCSHKSLPLEFTWKPHYSVHTRAFVWNLPGSLITMFTQEPSSGTYPGSLITVFVQEPSSGTYPGSLITVFTREPSSVIYLEASLQCSHKSLPLELTWKPHYSVHTRTFLWNLPGKSDSILIKNLCLCFPSQIIRLEF